MKFSIDDFSRWYIKLIRPRVRDIYKEEDKLGAFYTLYTVMRELSKLIAPFAPFLAEDIYQNMNKIKQEKESVHMEDFPSLNMEDENIDNKMNVVKEIFDTVIAMRQENKIKLRWPLKKVVIATHIDLSEMKKVIERICNVDEVVILKDYINKSMKKKSFSAGIIYMDVSVDMEKALTKEIIRRIQNMRKKMKLKVEDRIRLYLSSQKLKSIEDEFKEIVGAQEIIYGENDGTEVNILGEVIKIKIEKI